MRLLPVIIMITVYLGANFYVFFRLWHMIPAGNILRPLLIVFAVLAVSSMFLALLLGNHMPSPLVSVLYKLGTSWFFIFLYLLMIFIVLDIVRLTHLLPLNKYMFSSWTGLGILTGIVTVIMTLGYIRYLDKERVELTLNVDKELESPLKIVAISDLHLGYSIGKKEFERWVKKINAEKPDAILIAGDIIDNSLRPLLEQDMASSFRKLETRYGVFASPGNHEYISGIQACLNFMHEAGITLLQDSSVMVGGVYIVGRDDMTNTRRKPLEQLLDSLDRSKPVIVLDHQPHKLEDPVKNNVDLQFSGHTHRGQVWPISWITDRIFENSHGLLKKGDTNIFVSSGLGIWGGKFRIGTRSEYIVVTIHGRER